MPFSYSIHPEFNLLWVKRYGVISMKEVGDLTRELQQNPELLPGLQLLNDYRQVTDLEFGYKQIASVAEAARDLLWDTANPTRIAFVTSGPLSFGLARMFQSLMAGHEGVEIAVFDNIEAAADNLDLTAEARAFVLR